MWTAEKEKRKNCDDGLSFSAYPSASLVVAKTYINLCLGEEKKPTQKTTQEARASTSDARNQSQRAREVSDNIVFILKQSLTPFWILIINAYFFFHLTIHNAYMSVF